jgi:hypothetical protein
MTSDVVASDLGSEPPLHSPADDMPCDRVPEARPQGLGVGTGDRLPVSITRP